MQERNLSGDGLPCKQKVGFLFKRTCGRIDRTGCRYCQGQVQATNAYDDPYFHDRSMYNGYGRYDRGYWSNEYYDRHQFTDADSRAVVSQKDSDFEQRLDAS